jgi:DNA processing protein
MDERLPRLLEGAALPPALQELLEPPVRLFAHGDLPRGPCVAVVGTRHPTPEAEAFARQFARDLASRGVAVASGGAEGIDAAAHRGALDAGGMTLVVAPSSFDRPFPKKHAALFAEIVAKGGAYLSPFATAVVAKQHQFFLRNGVLVALSHALVIVEMPVRSGAMNAARWARRLGRPCFVVPSAPWNPAGLGGLLELERGARPAASVEPVLRVLAERRLHAIALPPPAPAPAEGADGPAAAQRKKLAGARAAGSGIDQAILEAIDAGVCYPAEIAQALSFSVGEVSHSLLLLTLRGLVRNDAGVLSRVRAG